MTPHPQRCKYLVNVGMYAQCQDSYCPARMQGCDHIIKPSCWGIASSEQEIREKVLDELIEMTRDRIRELKSWIKLAQINQDRKRELEILPILGENQGMWAQLQELREQGE